MLSRIVNFVTFQIGWFVCVLGASYGRPWLGPSVVLFLLSFYFWMVEDHWTAVRVVLVVGLVGAVIDSAFGYVGLLQFRDSVLANWLCPPWLVALWMIFATTLQHSLSWLAGRWKLAALLGGVFGPVSYYAGQEFGALRLGGTMSSTALALAAVWALLLPLLHWWTGKVTISVR